MSFLIKDTVGASKQFYFDGSRILDAMVQVLSKPESDGFVGLQYQFGGDDPKKDRDNIKILKEELGVIFIEKQMFKQFTRNNNDGDIEIKNNFQLNLYQDLVRTNNFLAAMFLYFFHKFNYDAWPDKVLTSSTDGIAAYKKFETNGLPSDKIIKQNLKETELIGQIQKIKPKRIQKSNSLKSDFFRNKTSIATFMTFYFYFSLNNITKFLINVTIYQRKFNNFWLEYFLL